jgi:hypothetical protein
MIDWAELEATLSDTKAVYEYKVLELVGKAEDDEAVLNSHGNQGWDLVAVVHIPTPAIVPGLRLLAYLKRAIK